jgi:ABC-type branched-subunit amino acid transport system ATPase component/ABC-type branched-subunit amino acid transport system permease subunit
MASGERADAGVAGGARAMRGGGVSAQALLALLVAGFAALPLVLHSPYHMHLLILFLLWVSLGEAWNLLGGFTGQVSFGHAAFFGTGAYVTSLLYVDHAVPLWLGGIVAGLAAAVLSVPVGLVCFRLRGPYFALTILGVSEILRLIATNWRSLTYGPVGVLFPPIFADKRPFYYIALALAVLTVGATWLTLRSKAGYWFRAVRDDQDAAAALGISPTRIKLLSLVESAFFTGVLGGFFAPYQGYIDPEVVFSIPDVSIAMVVVTVLGGMGSVWGPVIGAMIVVGLSEFIRTTLGGAHLLVYALVIIAIILFVPEGLVGIFRRLSARPVPERGAGVAPHAAASDGVARVSTVAASPRSHVSAAEVPLLVVEHLTKAFGGLLALHDVNASVRPGEVLGLIGPNGAGKTTLLSVISGFERPTSGRVHFAGADLTGMPAHRVARHGLARTFQIVRPLGKMTVRENVVTGALATTAHVRVARERADAVLRTVELYSQRDRLAANLTLAERKRLELARALATAPRLLLLDEVAAGLNASETKAMIAILERVREGGVTIVAVEHVMQVIMSISDRILVLHYGRVLAQGRPADVARDPEVVEAYLGATETVHA